MDSEKKATTQEMSKAESKPIDNIDNINKKVYNYYLWEKNKKSDEKLYVISKDDLSKLKDYIKYADLKTSIRGDNIIACIEDFYKGKKIEFSAENKIINIKIKEKKDKNLNDNEEEINENVVDL